MQRGARKVGPKSSVSAGPATFQIGAGRWRTKVILAAIFAAAGAYGGTHTGGDATGPQLELWQVINLIGAPTLAVMFARPVIDDIKAWLTSRRG